MHTKIKGTIAETAVLSDLYQQEYFVAAPIDDLAPFDLIAISMTDFSMYKVQVKYRSSNDGKIVLKYKNAMSNKTLSYRKKYQKIEVDVFAIYNPESKAIAYIPFEENKSSIALRLDKPKNNMSQGIRMFDDFKKFPF